MLLGCLLFASLVFFWSAHNVDSEGQKPLFAPLRETTEAHSLLMKNMPSNESEESRFRCIGWRATSKCTPDGPREPENDRNCTEVVVNGMSGYCELVDEASGERFRVMQRHCNSLMSNIPFTCSMAPDFASFHVEAHKAVELTRTPNFSLPHVGDAGQATIDGIVMVVYPKLLASAYVSISTLRNVLGCQLPIEIWFHADEIEDDYGLLAPLQQLSILVGGISFHEMYNPQAKGFYSKVFAIYNSHFDRVLFLDADNVPVRDPSFLFETPEFVDTGAVFWPDFWHPRRTLFNLHAKSMLWELLDMPYVDMFEQESGQLLIDRRRHAAPLELVYFYTFHEPNFFEELKLVYGDKDLFRLAWLKLGAAFHMIQTPPALAGKVLKGSFCGMTMVQHDADGDVLFLHRNQHKLTGKRDDELERAAKANTVVSASEALGALQPDGYPDPVIWTHLQSFRKGVDLRLYTIDAYRAAPQFPQFQPCYGHRDVNNNRTFQTQDIGNMSFAGLETDLRRFAMEAVQ
ncbi:hypothetical protein BBJ28_00016615 [Nothophytophthora sp. Chile5]|nr:hypothetical protein BBJ28_00016615 [Nothophytophthora sp. Chile5]